MYRKHSESSIPLSKSTPGPIRRRDCRDMSILANDPHFKQMVAKAMNKGTRAVTELLAEVAITFDAQDLIEETLSGYCRLDHEVLRISRGDRFAPPPIYLTASKEVR